MDISNLIGGVVGGVLGSSAIAAFVSKFVLTTLKEGWIEGVKAENAETLEKLKDSMERDQKTLQSRLDHGTYVTQAQYDLELSSYKDLWLAMSELRERWKGSLVQAGLHFKDEETRVAVLTQADKDVGAANDAAVLISGRLAPFYEKNIYSAAQAATHASTQLLLRLNECNASQTALPDEEVAARLTTIFESVEAIDGLIRERLSSLRLL